MKIRKSSQKRIPVSQPTLTAEDKAAVLNCLDLNYVSGDSPAVATFEENYATVTGRKFGIAVANGSVALDVVLHGLNLEIGDEVIVPSFTIASCLFAILRTGAKPVFVDVEEETWNMSIETILPKVTESTRAILVVHIYGLSVDMDPILQLGQERSIEIIEDSAEAHGVSYKGKSCGSFGLASTFSFYANKAITSGEGGMVLTDEVELAKRIRSLRNLSFAAPPARRFVHEEIGWNLRLSSMQAALGNSQLKRLPEIVNEKREIGLKYHRSLANCDGLRMQITETDYSKNMYWVVGVVLDKTINTQIVMSNLSDKGIDTRPFFYPLHKQPLLKKYQLDVQESLPTSELIGNQGFYLPSFLGLSEDDIEYICGELVESLVRCG
jgi:perosamine synthetase